MTHPVNKSVYESWEPADLALELHARYSVVATGDEGFDTMRSRFCVTCKDCNEVLHPNTTGPNSYIGVHEREKHGRVYKDFRDELEQITGQLI